MWHSSAKIPPPPTKKKKKKKKKKFLKTNIDKTGIHNSSFLLYEENINSVFFHQYWTSNTLV